MRASRGPVYRVNFLLINLVRSCVRFCGSGRLGRPFRDRDHGESWRGFPVILLPGVSRECVRVSGNSPGEALVCPFRLV